jgi:hypothetical protein
MRQFHCSELKKAANCRGGSNPVRPMLRHASSLRISRFSSSAQFTVSGSPWASPSRQTNCTGDASPVSSSTASSRHVRVRTRTICPDWGRGGVCITRRGGQVTGAAGQRDAAATGGRRPAGDSAQPIMHWSTSPDRAGWKAGEKQAGRRGMGKKRREQNAKAGSRGTQAWKQR